MAELSPTDTIILEPDWEVMCEFFARALATHSFEPGAIPPVYSLIEIVRYLAVRDPEALQRVIERLA
jgi:hypothetical protein